MLYNLRYTLTTAYGEATTQNWHNFIVAVFGIGQAATDGPSGWVFISDIILKCYAKLAKGCSIYDPGKEEIIPSDADMFVDDNTLMHNTGNFDKPATNLMQQVKYDTKYWGRLLWITGGLLEFLK
eukprot:6218010-Ditylum_brightwellii.AAC.1